MTVFLIFWPLAASLLLLLWRPARSGTLALAASLVEFVASAITLVNMDKSGTMQWVTNVLWIRPLGVHFYVGIDGIAILLVMLTTVLVPLIILSSFNQTYKKSSAFYGLILMMEMALVGVFTARDGFLFYIFWELALIPIYFICLVWGGPNRGRVTLKFFIYTLFGSLLMLVGMIILYLHTPNQTFDIHALMYAGQGLGHGPQSFVFWLFFVAFAIKMPIFPFHTWQPDTYTQAPVQGTMLLSGIMLKMGLYGVIRWLIPIVPSGVAQWGYTAVVLSVIGIVYASWIALSQKDMKRLIAYSSIAHVGLISAGLFTQTRIGIQGAVLQMISHGFIVFALFYVVDIIYERTRTRTLGELGGIRHEAPMLATVFTVVMLGSVALPLTSGFVGEFLLINSLVHYKFAIGLAAALTTVFGAIYMFRAFQQSMLGEVTAVTKGFKDLTLREKVALYPVILFVIFVGVYPAPLLALSEPVVNRIIAVIWDYNFQVK
jgi:NADH-quinone oxidoreductase subunit M